MYYNTNNEVGEVLKQSHVRSETQADKILRYFKNNPGREFTPFEIQRNVLYDSPVTSVRRAMTDLTNGGKLEKTSSQKMGKYSKMNYCWKLI